MFPRPIPRPLPLAATERKERDQSGWEFSRYGQSLASDLGGTWKATWTNITLMTTSHRGRGRKRSGLTPGSRVVGSADSSLRTVEKTHSRGWPTGGWGGGGEIRHYRCIWFTLEGKGRDIHLCVQTQKKTGKSQVFFTYYPLLCFLRQKLSLISSLTCRLNWLASMLVSAWGYKQVSSCMDWAHIVILYSKLFIHWAILYTTPALNLFLKLSNTYI